MTSFKLKEVPARPSAAIILPQLGSDPWTAVLTREDEAIVRAIARASKSLEAP